jgi:hypothetical protein
MSLSGKENQPTFVIKRLTNGENGYILSSDVRFNRTDLISNLLDQKLATTNRADLDE